MRVRPVLGKRENHPSDTMFRRCLRQSEQFHDSSESVKPTLNSEPTPGGTGDNLACIYAVLVFTYLSIHTHTYTYSVLIIVDIYIICICLCMHACMYLSACWPF